MPDGQVLSSSTEYPGKALGTYNAQLLLLDGAAAVDPGIWMPWSIAGFSRGSFEVTGTFDASVELKVSNAAIQPANTIRITIAGSVNTGDVIVVTINCAAFMGGNLLTTYTVLSTDTSLAILTTSLTAAINTSIANARNNNLIDTQTNNIAAGFLYALKVEGEDEIDIQWQWPLPAIGVTAVLTTGSDETFTVAPFDDGSGFVVSSCGLSSPANVPFDNPGTWIKACIPSAGFTSATSVTAIVQAVIP